MKILLKKNCCPPYLPPRTPRFCRKYGQPAGKGRNLKIIIIKNPGINPGQPAEKGRKKKKTWYYPWAVRRKRARKKKKKKKKNHQRRFRPGQPAEKRR
jgi:hypothetical protein